MPKDKMITIYNGVPISELSRSDLIVALDEAASTIADLRKEKIEERDFLYDTFIRPQYMRVKDA